MFAIPPEPCGINWTTLEDRDEHKRDQITHIHSDDDVGHDAKAFLRKDSKIEKQNGYFSEWQDTEVDVLIDIVNLFQVKPQLCNLYCGRSILTQRM